MKKLTPMMQQYMEIKNNHKDSLLFFRLGDFYEMFLEDAVIASRELEITLTQRKSSGEEEGIPMCGVPYHVADTYISRLVEKGYKVAICEQVEDPALAKGIVKREVIKVVTPGTITDSIVLDEKSNNYLASVYMCDLAIGITYVDNSTGEMNTTEYKSDKIDLYRFAINELGKINPSELICNEIFLEDKKFINIIKNRINPFITSYKEDKEISYENTLKLFKVKSLKEIKLDDKMYSVLSAEKLVSYLFETQKNSLDHINRINYYESKDYMTLDISTRINLELHETIMSRDKKGSLNYILDDTSTAMGARMLKKWIEEPLLNKEKIEKRLSIVEYFTNNIIFKDEVDSLLKGIYDIERLSGRISSGSCNARELISLKNSLKNLPPLKDSLITSDNDHLKNIGRSMDTLDDVYKLIDKSIEENPPISITEGNIIKKGFSEELDELKISSKEGKNWLASLEAKEREKTGINNLKIGYNKVAGYFIEVTKANTSKVPDYFIRKQTLTNSERYFTDELKSMEDKILGAEEKALQMEYEIFVKIRESIKKEIQRLQYVSKLVSTIDVLLSFAKIAIKNNYIKPNLNTKGIINIKEGRHPVVEKMIDNNLFVPNDTYLDEDKDMIQIITGPNMAGKSTYMRQVALITIMAQIGSFVPCEYADISIVDRIFTRIGASDNLSQGESTFMVEMNEVANIVREATSSSLLILDEVGRGTSTYDGLSIAWAIIEYIAEKIKAKTLFATHYHELTQLSERYDVIKNMTISAEEQGEDIVFLRKVIKGSTNKSYGIQVARLAGINEDILSRAREVLLSIESTHKVNINEDKLDNSLYQVNLTDVKKDYFIDKLIDINIDNLTPLDSMKVLASLIEDAKNLKEN